MMTTDDVKDTILKWYRVKRTWPTRNELEQALHAEGYLVDQSQIDDLLENLKLAHQVWMQDGEFIAKN